MKRDAGSEPEDNVGGKFGAHLNSRPRNMQDEGPGFSASVTPGPFYFSFTHQVVVVVWPALSWLPSVWSAEGSMIPPVGIVSIVQAQGPFESQRDPAFLPRNP